jgi:guanosine-3',5'-bis(diphosphate) 3'-pyrophosphohydrolase
MDRAKGDRGRMMRQYELVERVKRYNPSANEALLNRAYVYAMMAHGNQKRASGDLFFGHPLEVAAILTDLKLDDATIAAAVLHDTVEDTQATLEEINKTLCRSGQPRAKTSASCCWQSRTTCGFSS